MTEELEQEKPALKYLENKHDVWSDEGLFCPVCKKKQEDLFEVSGAYEDGDSATSCDRCGTEFNFSVNVSHSWTSLKVEG